MRMKLEKDFFQQTNVVQIAQDLLGKVICTHLEGDLTTAMITEVEAYRGKDDRACHAFGYKKTNRTKTMFLSGGHAYVYLCYGIHELFNIVTNVENEPDAVLIRSVQPLDGLEKQLERRKSDRLKPMLWAGPGKVSAALGINRSFDALTLIGNQIWLEGRGVKVRHTDIVADTRIGVEYAGEDAKRPWRFYLADNPYVSKNKI
jgi:DNA-3-methyladenine glycosylase